MKRLREYQKQAVTAGMNASGSPLIVAPPGSGKSLIIAKIIQLTLRANKHAKVVNLAHQGELLRQNKDELQEQLPKLHIGIFSASLRRKQLDSSATMMQVQTAKNALDKLPAYDLAIIDEAHMIPKDTSSTYRKVLDAMHTKNPSLRVIGLTATPYRMGEGELTEQDNALFDHVAFDIPMADLIDDGYLCPIISKGAIEKPDLDDLKRGSNGEFVLKSMSKKFENEQITRAAVKELVTLGKSRKSWIIFSASTKHAQRIHELLGTHGISSAVITQATSATQRKRLFTQHCLGDYRALISINTLTTGVNLPHTDMVVLLRATESAGLYVQMVGRGTRLSEGKKDLLLLDYGRNVERHGFIDDVHIREKGKSRKAITKQCPSCQTMVAASVRECPGCGHQFPEPQTRHQAKAYDGAVLKKDERLAFPWMITTIQEAKANNLKTYFNGKPCKRGNISLRASIGRGLCLCNDCQKKLKARKAKWVKDNPEYAKKAIKRQRDTPEKRKRHSESSIKWKRKNTEKVREYARTHYINKKTKNQKHQQE